MKIKKRYILAKSQIILQGYKISKPIGNTAFLPYINRKDPLVVSTKVEVSEQVFGHQRTDLNYFLPCPKIICRVLTNTLLVERFDGRCQYFHIN